MNNKYLLALLTIFIALALFYSILIPLFEGPDEDDHFRYAKYIADHRALPVQEFEPGGGEAGHQGWHPPLYYTLVALIVAPIDTTDFSEHLYRNYAASVVGDPSCCGRNLYFHFSNDNFPYTRATLAVHLARLLSVFFGAITVAATYLLADSIKDIAPHELRITNYELLSLSAASLVAFNPSFLFASALVSNDAPLAAFSSLVLLMWVKLLRGQIALNAKSAVILGALIALGVLTKTTALGLIPLTFLLFAVLAWRRSNPRLFLLSFVICSFVIALLSAWWFARNWTLYGDPLASRLVQASALFPRTGDLTLNELFNINLPWLWQTFWGGPTPGDFPASILIALGILSALTVLGLIKLLITNYELRITSLFLCAWLLLILSAQLQFIRITQGADQGRYIFPAISVFALFFALGLGAISDGSASLTTCFGLRIAESLPRVARPTLRTTQYALRIMHHASRITNYEFRILNFSLCLLALATPILYTLPNYARPALLSADELARAPNPAAINFANQIELRGYTLGARSTQPGESLEVTLYWRARARMPESNRVFVQLVGAEDRIVASADVIPARGAFPTVYWNPGDALRDTVRVSIRADAAPGEYAVHIGLYPYGKPRDRLEIAASGESSVIIGAVEVKSR